MRVPSTIVQHEFIGLHAEVVKSANPDYVGISGTVVNETRNTLEIRHKGRGKVVAKDVAVFRFTLPDGTIVEVDGKNLVGRPEDRVKRRLWRGW